MNLVCKRVAVIVLLPIVLLLNGCLKEMARAGGDAYKGVGQVIGDYGRGKYENKNSQRQGGSYQEPVNKPASRSQRYTDGNTVAFAQRKLNELGYDAGKVDGIFGDRTRVALKLYQMDQGIRTSGVIDDATLDRLHAGY